ncbi:MAG: protease inhibitor I42 family protein [bacterium]
MLSLKKGHLFFFSLLIVLLSLSFFVVNAHAQYPYGAPVGGGYYPYGGGGGYYPYGGGGGYYPYGGGGGYYPYGGGGGYYPYGGGSYYPYGGGSYYPYSGGGYYPYNYYPYQQANYQQADLMLDSTDNGDDFTVDKGDTISIILSSNSSTGYIWMLDADEPDTDIVSKTSSQYFQGYTGMVGASGSEQWIFEAEDEGTTNIILYYRRTWEATVAETFEVEITVE